MAATWTADRTWVAGELVTAAIMNQYVRDNLDWLKTPTESGKITFATTFTTTSASYVDITGLTSTITTNGGGLDVELRLSSSNSGVQTATYQLLIDGVADCVLGGVTTAIANNIGNATYVTHIAAIVAGSHTFKIQVKTTGNTLSVYGTTSTVGDPLFYVVERGS